MKLRNEITGDQLEIPPPDKLGKSVVLLNGREIAQVFYSDSDNTVTLGDGQFFKPSAFAEYLVKRLAVRGERAS